MKILLRVPNWLGDDIMALPAVNLLRQSMPSAHIAVLVSKNMAAMWEMTTVDQIIPFSVRKGMKGLSDRLWIAREIRKQKFDCAVIFPNSFDAALVPFLARIAIRIGWPTQNRGILLNHKIAYPHHLDDQQQWKRDAFLIKQAFNCKDNGREQVNLSIQPEIASQITKRLAKYPQPMITLNPGATYGPAKCWLQENYAELAVRLNQKYQVTIVIIGGPGDVKVCNKVHEMIKSQSTNHKDWCLNIAGQTNIPELAGWLAQARCTVTNDTGGMHISAAVGTVVVAIFGPTNWLRTAPLGPNHILIKSDIICKKKCKRRCLSDHRCMTSVTVEMVLKAIDGIIDN